MQGARHLTLQVYAEANRFCDWIRIDQKLEALIIFLHQINFKANYCKNAENPLLSLWTKTTERDENKNFVFGHQPKASLFNCWLKLGRILWQYPEQTDRIFEGERENLTKHL